MKSFARLNFWLFFQFLIIGINGQSNEPPSLSPEPCIDDCCIHIGGPPDNCTVSELGDGADLDGRCNDKANGQACRWNYEDETCCIIANGDAIPHDKPCHTDNPHPFPCPNNDPTCLQPPQMATLLPIGLKTCRKVRNEIKIGNEVHDIGRVLAFVHLENVVLLLINLKLLL